MIRLAVTVSVLASLLASRLAAADDYVAIDRPLPRLAPERVRAASDERPFVPHINTGLEGGTNGDIASLVWRTHVGLSYALGGGRIRPTIGGGATFGWGTLSAADARALDGTVDVGYLDLGPELQVGLRFADGGVVDTRVFASAAYLRTDLDERLMLDAVGGIGGTRGMRFSVGVNWADQIVKSRSEDAFWWFLLPQQAELQWTDSAGSRRMGVTLSYGI